jgi:hypothetical protein
MCTMLLSERQIENFDIIAAAKHVGTGAECFETCDVKVLALHAFDDLVISSYLHVRSMYGKYRAIDELSMRHAMLMVVAELMDY